MARDPVERGPLVADGVEVPYTRLAPDVLRRVIEEFVTSEGTEYGSVEKTLEAKVADVMRQLDRGRAVIVYDAESQAINIVAVEPSGRRRAPAGER